MPIPLSFSKKTAQVMPEGRNVDTERPSGIVFPTRMQDQGLRNFEE